MLFSTVGQGPVFILMAGAGLLIGALYSATGLLRSLMGAGFWLGLAADLFFGLAAAVVLIAALLLAGYGRFRMFELLGALTGVVLFRLGAEPPLRAAFRTLKRTFRHILVKIASYRLIKVIFK